MTLQDIRSECSDTAALLQPHVDGELSADEQERVGAHLEACRPCRMAVQEQLWVKQTLREVERPKAPQALRARILLDLDEVDAENAEAAATPAAPSQPGLWSRITGRARDLMRGGMIMVPAGAVAVALFFVAQEGFEPTKELHPSGLGAATFKPANDAETEKPSAPSAMEALAEVEPQVAFPIQVPGRRSSKVQLVGARLSEPAGQAEQRGARLRYKVFSKGRETGHHVVDWQLPASSERQPERSAKATPVNFRGRQYVLDRGSDGEPIVHFERRGVAHMLRLEAGAGSPSAPPEGNGAPGDYSVLLDLADHLHRTSP